MKTLDEAKAELIKGVIDGVICPCCGRLAKVNKIAITGSMVRSLSWIASESKKVTDGWVPVQDTAPGWLLRSNSHAKLIHWGLIERRESTTSTKLYSGVYRPTRDGVDFLNGDLSVKRWAFTYNNILLKLSGPLISAADCISTGKFTFGE